MAFQDPSVRAFLLTNLNASQAPFKFKVPIDILKEGRPEIESFPYAPGERVWNGDSLFVKGSRSKYVASLRKDYGLLIVPDSSIGITSRS